MILIFEIWQSPCIGLLYKMWSNEKGNDEIRGLPDELYDHNSLQQEQPGFERHKNPQRRNRQSEGRARRAYADRFA
jgi:hypothetical protein